jgi:hypothetical protein
MSLDEICCFELLDTYARSRCGCFLTEFFRKAGADEAYVCCSRPAGAQAELTDRYICKYLTVDAADI